MSVETRIRNIEDRFMVVSNLKPNLTVFPISNELATQVKTNKEKSDTFGEVFTPLWLVDDMLELVSKEMVADQNKITLDLCAGYGQFTIRLLRYKYAVLGETFNLNKFLANNTFRKKPATHSFAEIQLSSCYKLLYVFGVNINLFIGDAQKLSLMDENEKGILVFKNDKWHNITDTIQNIFAEHSDFTDANVESFCNKLTSTIEALK